MQQMLCHKVHNLELQLPLREDGIKRHGTAIRAAAGAGATRPHMAEAVAAGAYAVSGTGS
eukprot:6452343-Prymnesium_polylepis.1